MTSCWMSPRLLLPSQTPPAPAPYLWNHCRGHCVGAATVGAATSHLVPRLPQLALDKLPPCSSAGTRRNVSSQLGRLPRLGQVRALSSSLSGTTLVTELRSRGLIADLTDPTLEEQLEDPEHPVTL